MADSPPQPTSRDPLGARPLVYTQAGGGISAEHECELLARLPTVPAPDAPAVRSWVDRGLFPAGRTLYEGVRRVPPGHRARREAGSLVIEREWGPRYRGTFAGSREEIATLLRGEVFAAVVRAVAGPGLTAAKLSGGLDSAALAAGLASGGELGAVALSAVFPDHPATDERELIEATLERSGLAGELIEFPAGRPILPPALAHIERWRLPPTTPNLFVWEPLMARARELGVARMIDGEGGDELFGTVPALIADRLRGGRLVGAWGLCGEVPGVGEHPETALRLRILRRFGVNPLVPAAVLRRRHLRHARSHADGSLLAAADRIALIEMEEDRRPPDGPLWWRQLAATLTGGGDELDVAGHLRRVEIDEKIERRHPFQDDLELVEAVLQVPPELAFDPLLDRPLLRHALAGHAADEVLSNRRKARFNPLLGEALAGPEGDRLLAGPAETDAPIREFVDGRALDRLLAVDRSRASGEVEQRLWRLGTTDLWLRAL